MRIGFLTTGGAIHRYVLAEVLRAFPATIALRAVRSPTPPKPRSERLARWTKQPTRAFSQKVHERLRDARLAHIEETARRALFTDAAPPLTFVDVARSELHAPSTLERVRGFDLDVLLVSGAPLLKPSLFRLPRLGTVNLHYGIAPRYRGEDTLFWPVYERNYDDLGVTLHYIDEGVDSGEILARGFVARDGGESEAELWVACARLGARLMNETLSAFSDALRGSSTAPARLRGQAQVGPSRQYFIKQRRLWHDATVVMRRRLEGGIPKASERVEICFRE